MNSPGDGTAVPEQLVSGPTCPQFDRNNQQHFEQSAQTQQWELMGPMVEISNDKDTDTVKIYMKKVCKSCLKDSPDPENNSLQGHQQTSQLLAPSISNHEQPTNTQYETLIQRINKNLLQVQNDITLSSQSIVKYPMQIQLPTQDLIDQVQNVVICKLPPQKMCTVSNIVPSSTGTKNHHNVQHSKSNQSLREKGKQDHVKEEKGSDILNHPERGDSQILLSHKTMTGVLLDKIQQLQDKVIELQEEKLNVQTQNQTNLQYSSSPNYAITSRQVNRTSPAINHMQATPGEHSGSAFRVRHLGTASQPSICSNRLQSNIYNMTVLELNNGPRFQSQLGHGTRVQSQLGHGTQIQSEIKALKEQLNALERNYSLHDRSSFQNNNEKILGDSLEEKHHSISPDRTHLNGKIIKRDLFTLLHASESNPNISSEVILTPKGFIRNTPAFKAVEQQIDSAIFRKSTSAVSRAHKGMENVHHSHDNFREFKTLEFNPEKEKLVIDSKETEEMPWTSMKDSPISPIQKKGIEEIRVPHLEPHPEPHNTEEELVQIGKLTFSKMGCQVRACTELFIKKYINCVYFSLGIDKHILWHYDGKFYFGGWREFPNGEGEKSGEAIECSPGKYNFKGFFANGKRNGYGVLALANGSTYAGQWENGVKHGSGCQVEPDGYTYEGEWADGKKNGSGKIINRGQLQFEGEFMNGLKNGYGSQKFSNGDQYNGNYVNNKFQGEGTYKWKSGAHYVGSFKAGRRHGHGVWRTAAQGGDVYEGEYKNDQKHGRGIYRWENGSYYEGEFEWDEKHGQGTITYENGKVAHLLWEKGKVLTKTELSSRSSNTQPKNEHKLERNRSHKIVFHASNAMKGRGLMRPTEKIESAKSTSSLPRGIKSRRTSLQCPETTRLANEELLKIKLHPKNRHTHRGCVTSRKKTPGSPCDPPYRGLQTSKDAYIKG